MARAKKRNPISLPPDFVRFVPQNGEDADCAVATLGTLFGLTRDEALIAFGAAAPTVLIDGMTDAEVDEALGQLGLPYARLLPGEFDMHDATGVLAVGRRQMEHFTFLWAGRVIDGRGEHWLDPDDYLAHYKWKPIHLIVRTDA
jgi:hypothetical protein